SWLIFFTREVAISFAEAEFLISFAIAPERVNANSFAIFARSDAGIPPLLFAWGTTPPAAKWDAEDWGTPPNQGTLCAARIGAISGTRYLGIIASPGSSIAGIISPSPVPGTIPPVCIPIPFVVTSPPKCPWESRYPGETPAATLFGTPSWVWTVLM